MPCIFFTKIHAKLIQAIRGRSRSLEAALKKKGIRKSNQKELKRNVQVIVSVVPLYPPWTERDDWYGTRHERIFMDFEIYWTLIGGDERFANRKEAARQLWLEHPEKHFAIITWLRAHGKYPARNPYFFILDFQSKRRQTLSYADYYARFGTTEPRDGWVRTFIPEEQRTVYVKAG